MGQRVGIMLGCLAIAMTGCSSHKSIAYVTPTTEVRSTGQPTGSFAQVAKGTNDGISWRLSRAPGTEGRACYKLETGPAVDLIQSALECPNPPAATASPDFNTEFPFETGATTAHDIVVGVARHPIKDAQFQFVVPPTAKPKTAKPVFIDMKNGIVVWAGKSKPYLGSVQMTLDDGSKIDCGPGDIQSADQLSTKTEKQVLQARQFVWTCIIDVAD